MDSNKIIEQEKAIIDNICDRYNYDNNIRHLLYIIIPAFIIKYGFNKEKMILNAFRDIRIMITNEKKDYVKAFFSSKPIYENGEYKSIKIMVLQNYNNTNLVDLYDNLVHEFNHAINSYINEMEVGKNYLYLRTGLTYRVFRKKDLSFVRKDPSYLLEEIINTEQTSDIINIIKGFDQNNPNIANTIYAINSETGHKYNSNSYFLEGYVCKQILENKTFIRTLETLRINGDVYDIGKWFDNITGEDGSYKELIRLLNDIYNLELQYANKKYFKSFTLGKIKDVSRSIMRIVNKFNNNVVYK